MVRWITLLGGDGILLVIWTSYHKDLSKIPPPPFSGDKHKQQQQSDNSWGMLKHLGKVCSRYLALLPRSKGGGGGVGFPSFRKILYETLQVCEVYIALCCTQWNLIMDP